MSSEIIIIAKEDLNSLHIVGGHGTKLNVGNHKLNQLSYYFEVSVLLLPYHSHNLKNITQYLIPFNNIFPTNSCNTRKQAAMGIKVNL